MEESYNDFDELIDLEKLEMLLDSEDYTDSEKDVVFDLIKQPNQNANFRNLL